MKFIPFFFLIFLLSCASKQKIPAGVLPVPKMSAVLWQVMQADAVVNRRAMIDSGLKRFDTSMVLYRQIFAAQKVSADQFKKSVRFYEAHPDLLEIIFDSLQHKVDAFSIPKTDSAKLSKPV